MLKVSFSCCLVVFLETLGKTLHFCLVTHHIQFLLPIFDVLIPPRKWQWISLYLELLLQLKVCQYWFLPYINTGIHVFPILNPPPSSLPVPSLWSSQCTSPKQPLSCIKPGLASPFIYDITHVSVPFSQIIPPSPSPTESKRLF